VTPCTKLCHHRIRLDGVAALADAEPAVVVASAGYYCHAGSEVCIP